MGRAAAALHLAKSTLSPHRSVLSERRETVDAEAYDGWDFAQLNSDARELRAVRDSEGYDAMVSRSSGQATRVIRDQG